MGVKRAAGPSSLAVDAGLARQHGDPLIRQVRAQGRLDVLQGDSSSVCTATATFQQCWRLSAVLRRQVPIMFHMVNPNQQDAAQLHPFFGMWRYVASEQRHSPARWPPRRGRREA
jgi:hypothetical protein